MTEDKTEKAVAAARALLATESLGLLSTISVRRAGTPYGSLTPYALSAAGRRSCCSRRSPPTRTISAPIPAPASSSATTPPSPIPRRARAYR